MEKESKKTITQPENAAEKSITAQSNYRRDVTMRVELNVDRIIKAMETIEVKGVPDGGIRLALIETAIRNITNNGHTALAIEYLGVKNYAAFGDQREDHPYGSGPKHGVNVFTIARTHETLEDKPALGLDEIYLLECVRDFGTANVFNPSKAHYFAGNLLNLIVDYTWTSKHLQEIARRLKITLVDLQTPALIEEEEKQIGLLTGWEKGSREIKKIFHDVRLQDLQVGTIIEFMDGKRRTVVGTVRGSSLGIADRIYIDFNDGLRKRDILIRGRVVGFNFKEDAIGR